VGELLHNIVEVGGGALNVQFGSSVEQVVFLAEVVEGLAHTLEQVGTAVQELRHGLGLFVHPT